MVVLFIGHSVFADAIVGAAAGLLGAAAFEPLAIWPLMIASIAILSWSVRRSERPAVVGLIYGLAFFLPLLKWSGTYVGALPWLALSLLQAAFFVPAAVAIARLQSPWLIGAVWVALEALRSRIPWGGFGWGRVAFSQADSPVAILATLGGAALVTYAIVVVASTFSVKRFAGLFILLLIPVAHALAPNTGYEQIKVAVVQGNVPRLGLDFNAQREAVLKNHLTVTARIPRASVDLVVWPENASDVDPYSVSDQIQEVVDAIDAPVLVGGIPRINGNLYNASILWRPNTGPASAYFKQDLAPFGEYMPLRPLAERLVPEAKRVEDFTAGRSLVLHHVDNTTVGSIICFEILNDGLVRRAVTSGADLLAVQTNSATFGTSSESAQQLGVTRLRAIEFARPIASVSTSGISALITSKGEVLNRSGIFEQRVLTNSLKLVSGQTISAQIGGWGELGLILLPWLAFAVGSRRRR